MRESNAGIGMRGQGENPSGFSLRDFRLTVKLAAVAHHGNGGTSLGISLNL